MAQVSDTGDGVVLNFVLRAFNVILLTGENIRIQNYSNENLG